MNKGDIVTIGHRDEHYRCHCGSEHFRILDFDDGGWLKTACTDCSCIYEGLGTP